MKPGRGPFDVWAPRTSRLRLLCGDNAGDAVVEMSRGDDDWWTPAGPLPQAATDDDVAYGYLLDDDPEPRPDPRSRRQPGGVHELSRTVLQRRATGRHDGRVRIDIGGYRQRRQEALARFVRRFRPELPVVLMSGYADKAATGLEDSALPVLAKPFTQELLLEALHAAIA